MAHYRKLEGLSAEALARRAGAGLTRSVIANLENDRKNDVTVNQLLALSSALGIPPVALAVDLSTPFGRVDVRDVQPEDAPWAGEGVTGVKHAMVGWVAIDWFAGLASPPLANRTSAGGEAYSMLDHLRDFKRLSQYEARISIARQDIANNDADPDRVAQIEAEAKEVRNFVQLSRDRLKRLGVDLDALEEKPVKWERWFRDLYL